MPRLRASIEAIHCPHGKVDIFPCEGGHYLRFDDDDSFSFIEGDLQMAREIACQELEVECPMSDVDGANLSDLTQRLLSLEEACGAARSLAEGGRPARGIAMWVQSQLEDIADSDDVVSRHAEIYKIAADGMTGIANQVNQLDELARSALAVADDIHRFGLPTVERTEDLKNRLHGILGYRGQESLLRLGWAPDLGAAIARVCSGLRTTFIVDQIEQSITRNTEQEAISVPYPDICQNIQDDDSLKSAPSLS